MTFWQPYHLPPSDPAKLLSLGCPEAVTLGLTGSPIKELLLDLEHTRLPTLSLPTIEEPMNGPSNCL